MSAELPVRITADLTSFKRDLAGAQQSSAGVATELNQAAGHAGGLSAGLHGAHKSARALGGALKLIDPELGSMVREVGHFAKGLNLASAGGESLLLGLGAIAAVVVVLAEGFKHYGEEAEKANKKTEESAVLAAKAMIGEFEASNKSFLSAQKSADEANQNLIDLENQQERVRNNIELTDQTRKIELKTIEKQIEAAKEEKVAAESLRDAQKGAFKQTEVILDTIHDKEGEARKDDKKRDKALEEREKLLAQVAQREEDVADFYDAEARKKSIENEEDRVAAIESEVRATAELAEAQGTIKEQMAAHADQAKAVGIAWLDTAGIVNNAVGGMFENSRAAALATAFVNIALGATKTIAELGATPFLAPALVAEGALGAAAIAKISQQSFTPKYHSGGVIPINAQPGEGILNRHGMRRLGPKGLDELNRGGSSSKGSVLQTTNVIGHRAMDTWAVKSLSRMSSPTRSAIQKIQTGVRPGRRDRTS